MRYILLAILLITVTWNTYSQVSNSKVVRIANASTTFSDPLSEGSLVIDLATDKCYLMLQGVAGTNSLNDLTLNTHYKELTSLADLSASSITVDTLTADSISLNALTYNDTFYDDLQVNPVNAKINKSEEPSTYAYKGGYVVGFADAADEVLYFTAQLHHQYKEGTNLNFHLHLIYADGTTGNADWTFTYSWANVHTNFPTESTINTTTAAPGEADYAAIGSIGELNGTGKNMSSLLICSLTRNGTAGTDTYANTVYVVSMDFHMEMDKPGSDGPF